MKQFTLFIFTLFTVSLYAEKVAIIEVSGMTCPLCTVAIKRSLKHTDGVVKAKVKLNTRKATVTFKDDTNETVLLNAIKKAGYTGKIISIKQVK